MQTLLGGGDDPFGFLKSLIGIEQTLQQFKESWEAGKEGLGEKLEGGRSSFRTKLLEVFRKSTPTVQKFMAKPSEHRALEAEGELQTLLQELAGKGIPGAGLLAQACQKYGAGEVLEEVTEYMESLDASSVDGIVVSDSGDEEWVGESEEDEEGSEEDESEEESSEEESAGKESQDKTSKSKSIGSGRKAQDESEEEESEEEDDEQEETDEEDDDDDDSDDEGGKRTKKGKKGVTEISEPVFAKDPDRQESRIAEPEEEEEEEDLPQQAGPGRLSWKTKEGRQASMSKKKELQIAGTSAAAVLYKQLVGLDDDLEKWKPEWTELKESLQQEELEHQARDYKVPVMEIFDQLGVRDAKEFMMSPYEAFLLDFPEEVERILRDLDRLDVPGADFLIDAIGKFKVEKIAEAVLDYFDLMRQPEMSLDRESARVVDSDVEEEEVEDVPALVDEDKPDPDILALFAPAFVKESPVPEPQKPKKGNFSLFQKVSDSDDSDGPNGKEVSPPARDRLPQSARTKPQTVQKVDKAYSDEEEEEEEEESREEPPVRSKSSPGHAPAEPVKTAKGPSSPPSKPLKRLESNSKLVNKSEKKAGGGGGCFACFSPKVVDD